MKKFEAKCLEEVYELAAADFKCSITELDINLIQQPSKGFLGFGKKTAIIEVCFKENCKRYETERTNETFRKKDIQIDDVSKRINDSNKNDELVKNNLRSQNKPILNEVPKDNSKNKIFDNFYNEDKSQTEMSTLVVKKNKDELLNEITEAINLLFKDTCYEIDNIKINFYDDETLYVEFTGKDSALLIGKEGYRYKALSYILFNWINEKYGLMLRLEVAEFLKNQETSIYAYLEPVIEVIKEKGTFKTKPLDGILVHIALKKLREEFPNKYVAVKTNVRGDKYVLVNEYKSKEQ